jgi:nitrogen fixation protein FixH
MTTNDRVFEIRGGHVLAFMIAFFAIIIGVNVAFSVVAVRSFPGEDEKHSYLQGLNFNSKLQDRARQAALGWRATADVDQTAQGPVLTVRLLASTGAPVTGLHVQGVLRRPVTSRDDRAVAFSEDGAGVYRARLGRIDDGVWVLRATAADGERHLDIERRMEWTAP